jgi:cyclophilin family peptidyl-prolyl cis-trans isomerase
MGVIQGGGYDTNLVKKTPNPAIINESSNGLSNLRGTIAMARTPYPHSATSEFFINQVDNLFLDYGEIAYNGQNAYYKVGYCVFGKVISGIAIVDAIAVLPKTNERPDEDVIIQSAAVTLEVPFCTEKLEGDVDSDCDVDTDDIFKFAIQWLNPKCEGCYSSDLNSDGNIDFADFAKMAANWLNCTSITSTCN